jgi:hypothetical protein
MKNILEYLPPTMPATSFLIEDGLMSGIRTEKKQTSVRLVSKFSEAAFDFSSEEWPSREAILPVAERALLTLGNPDRAAILMPDVIFRMQVLELEGFPKKDEEKEKIVSWQVRRNLGHPVQDLKVRYFPLEHEGDYTKLWVAAAPKELISNFEKAFGDKGCHIGFIASPAMVLKSLLLKRGIFKAVGLELLLNITERSMTFLFIRNGEPVFFRTKELRYGEDIEDRLAQEVRLTLAFQKERLGTEGLKRVCYRIAMESLSFPGEEFEESTEIVSLNDISVETEAEGIPRYTLLPLLASLEED